jgi:hypothetical protein
MSLELKHGEAKHAATKTRGSVEWSSKDRAPKLGWDSKA